MVNKINLQIVPINKFGYPLEEITSSINNDSFKSVKDARNYLKNNLEKLMDIFTNIYKEKMTFFAAMEIRILKANKLKARYQLDWEVEN